MFCFALRIFDEPFTYRRTLTHGISGNCLLHRLCDYDDDNDDVGLRKRRLDDRITRGWPPFFFNIKDSSIGSLFFLSH